VRGTLPIALSTSSKMFEGIILPEVNAEEAILNKKIAVYTAKHLDEAIMLVCDKSYRKTYVSKKKKNRLKLCLQHDFKEVKGQAHVKRGLEIAAAGGHNVLLLWTQYQLPLWK